MSEELAPPPVAYIAAIIDAFGGIRTRVTEDGTALPMVFVHGPNIALLELLAASTGTKVTVVRRGYAKAGCAAHCPEKHQHVTSVSGRWSVTGVKATVLLWNIKEHMYLQCEVATEALVLGLSSPFKPATPAKMAKLGWDIPDFGVR